jgi:hypothetical protein
VASQSASPQSGGNSISAGCPYGFKLSFYKQGLFAIFEKDRRTSRKTGERSGFLTRTATTGRGSLRVRMKS